MHMADRPQGAWHGVAWLAEILPDRPLIREVAGTVMVAFHSNRGYVVAKDDCPHQGASFAQGRVTPDGCLVCPFHGWTFDGSGRYVQGFIGRMAAPVEAQLRLVRYPVRVHRGRLWVWTEAIGKGHPDGPLPALFDWFATCGAQPARTVAMPHAVRG
jgi:phenylpropionate dioxygenase-like ring-hydroxylating dioxygenase large terminal subunit